jgi:hypothetical protein
MSKTFTDVSVFLTAVGQQVPAKPIGETDQSKLYKKLIDEEYHEFLEAFYTDDTVEEIDACFDMMWVIVGYMK